MAKLKSLKGIANNLSESVVGPIYGVDRVITSTVPGIHTIRIDLLKLRIEPKTRGMLRIMRLYRKWLYGEADKLGIARPSIGRVLITITNEVHRQAFTHNHVKARVEIAASGRTFSHEAKSNWMVNKADRRKAKTEVSRLVLGFRR